MWVYLWQSSNLLVTIAEQTAKLNPSHQNTTWTQGDARNSCNAQHTAPASSPESKSDWARYFFSRAMSCWLVFIMLILHKPDWIPALSVWTKSRWLSCLYFVLYVCWLCSINHSKRSVSFLPNSLYVTIVTYVQTFPSCFSVSSCNRRQSFKQRKISVSRLLILLKL